VEEERERENGGDKNGARKSMLPVGKRIRAPERREQRRRRNGVFPRTYAQFQKTTGAFL
jgi:hypothetical protein